jgi:O-antigen/teichoic acid export membrane protein
VNSLVNRPPFSLKRAATLNWISVVVNLGLSFLLTPFVLNALGPEGVGIWAVIQSFSGSYGLINMGLGSAVGRFINVDVAKGDLESLQETVDSTTVFFAVTGAIILALVLAFGKDAASWLKIQQISPEAFSQILLVCAIGTVVEFFGVISGSLLDAAERMHIGVINGIVCKVAQVVGTFLVLNYQPGLLELSLVVTSTTLIGQASMQSFARKSIPDLRFLPTRPSMKRLGDLLRYGSVTMLITISNLVRLRLGNIILARQMGMAAVSNYSIAIGLVNNYNSIIAGATRLLGVRFTKLDATGAKAELHRTYRMALFGISFIAFGIAAGIFIFADRFLTLWLGREMNETARVLQILTLAYMFALAQGPGRDMMYALAKHKPLAWVTAAECVANLVLALIWSPLYGAVGFAWATAVPMLFTKLLFQPWYASKVCDMPLRAYLSPMIIPALAGVVLAGGCWILGMESWLRTQSAFHFILAAVMFSGCYVLIVFLGTKSCDYMPPSMRKLWRRRAIIP